MLKIMSEIGERLLEEVDRLGGVSVVAKQLQAARNTIYNWTKKGNIPATDLIELEAMGADAVYILTGRRSCGALPPREAALVDNYRATDERGRRIIEQTASVAAESFDMKQGKKAG